ncbi:phage holin family protein [Mesorhizobium sp. KR2-14]|uniref:phage holin family protein n=1 Tax=Mesorhizobium sp. KR2-14 TaxID=3156610 RepID=UPI0032B4CD86
MAHYSRTIPDIFTDVVSLAATLVRKESQLARTEISENIGRVGAGIGLLTGGAVLMIPALVILLQAAVEWVSRTYAITPALSALILGGIVFVIGLILLLVGVNRLKVRTMVPDRTIRQIQQDANVAQEQMRPQDAVH